MASKRLLLIGLDGATWDVLSPLMEDGCLPNLRKLRDGGTHGILRSNFPPVTGSAWMSIATGKDPGENGIFDFLVMDDRKSLGLRPVNSSDYIRNNAVWDRLGAAGKKVGVVGYPMLYPPYEVNGVMISGLGAPEDGDIFYPADLKERLEKQIGKHRIYVSFARPQYSNPGVFIRDLEGLIEYNRRLADLLIDESYDFFAFIISASDFLGHYGWKWWKERSGKHHQTFRDLWKKIDDVVGLMVGKWGEGNIMVISDHGMGEIRDAFYVNKWLQREGYLTLKKSSGGSTFKSSIRKKGLRLIGKVAPRLADHIDRLRRRRGGAPVPFSEQIDMEKTRAFALEHSGLGNIYINAANGYSELRTEVMSRMRDFFGASGRKLEAYVKEEVFSGEFLDNLPDIVFMIDDNMTEVISGTPPGDELFRKHPTMNKTGCHRIDGIYILPPEMKDRTSGGAQLTLPELAAIIMELTGTSGQLPEGGNKSGADIKQEENAEIIDKLRGLGYL